MYDAIIKTDGDCALYVPCSLVQLARVVICVRVLVDVICVMIILIGHVDVVAVGTVLVSIFVVIFCNWRCTLYTKVSPESAVSSRSSVYLSSVSPSATRPATLAQLQPSETEGQAPSQALLFFASDTEAQEVD